MKTNTAIMTMIVAMVAMIGMTGLAMADSTMDYTVDFNAVGTGSVDIQTVTPDGIDFQRLTFAGCDVSGHQTGYDSPGSTWTTIDRWTSVKTPSGVVFGQSGSPVAIDAMITTGSYLPASGYKAGSVETQVVLKDNGVYNTAADYATLDQTTYLKTGGEIRSYTDIEGRVFANGPYPAPIVSGIVTTTSNGVYNASSSIYAGLTTGELDMDVYSRLIEGVSESSRTTYTVVAPDMSGGYTEQSDGVFQGYASVNGVVQKSMMTEFVNADHIEATGYFYAVTL